MTPKVDLTEFLTAYIAEVDEQLASASGKLLQIEASARQGERQPRAVRALFRAMHTIKGLSSMVGVESIVSISHRMESVLRDADRAGGALSPKVVDVLLQSVRVIEQCVRAVERGGGQPEASAAFLSELDALSPGDAAPVPTRPMRLSLDPSLEDKLDAFEQDLILKGVKDGRRALRVDYVPTQASVAAGLNINAVRERVGELGEIVRVIPIAVATTALAPGGIAFAILVLTSRTDAELAAAAGVEPATIRSIVEVQSPPDLAPVVVGADDRLPELEPGPDEALLPSLLRVDVSRVDDAMERLGMLLVTRSRLTRAIAALAGSGADTRELAQIAQENARQLRDLRSSILQVRMVPLSEILDRVPLIVRAASRASGRHVRLQREAAGAELDKAVAERVFPAIVHLVRNAVDHGIEPVEERERAGKPAEGTVTIACSARSSTRLELSVRDDGRGIDPAAVARRAGVATLGSDAALLDVLCQPGFSTRSGVTTTSGRGLGMDIVKRIVVDQLGGELTMQTTAGRGTAFIIQVPLTVAIVDAFVVECSGERFVVPVAVVEEIIEIDPERVVTPPRGLSLGALRPVGLVARRGEALPLYALATLLGLGERPEGRRRALVIRRAGEGIGILLDRVCGQQEAVIRPLADPLVHVTGISAATDLGDGRPALVLDLAALVGRLQRVASSPTPAALSIVTQKSRGDSP